MSSAQEFWTEDRISRLELILRKEQGDAAVEALLDKLAQCRTIDEKRQLIIEDLVPALQYVDGVRLWEGRVIPTRIALRDIIQDFLHQEGIIENVPTNELDTPQEATERERVASLFSQGKSASDIVIEDRGPL